MIIDASALIAIVYREPEGPEFADKIARAPLRLMSAAGFLEAAIVADRSKDPARSAALDALIQTLDVDFAPVTIEQARVARDAFRKYGKGVHPAALDFGDCFAYALAKVTGDRLLFKGCDFSQTDIEPA